MQLQDVVVAKRLSTDIAAVGLFFGVSPHVNLQLLAATESLLTDVADVGSLPRVRSLVDDQLTALYESLAADLTLVGSLSRVYSHVTVEFARVLKTSITEGAVKLSGSLTVSHELLTLFGLEIQILLLSPWSGLSEPLLYHD